MPSRENRETKDTNETKGKKEMLVEATKTLLRAERDINIAILHCLMDTSSLLVTTKKTSEMWGALLPQFSERPELETNHAALSPDAGKENNPNTVFKRPS
ncbi:hypothetical protein F5B17DRAFT_453239 [Nemania serpens]|nr:hypothetical protein F5B17DRAFT_453239 [Nemania serpens]